MSSFFKSGGFVLVFTSSKDYFWGCFAFDRPSIIISLIYLCFCLLKLKTLESQLYEFLSLKLQWEVLISYFSHWHNIFPRWGNLALFIRNEEENHRSTEKWRGGGELFWEDRTYAFASLDDSVFSGSVGKYGMKGEGHRLPCSSPKEVLRIFDLVLPSFLFIIFSMSLIIILQILNTGF